MKRLLSYIVKKTPIQLCSRLSRKYDCNILLKREDLQTTRSFKIRGAFNKIIKQSHDKILTYITASAGNHAQGVAYICNKLNLNCQIFVPDNTPMQKITQIRSFGNNNCDLIVDGENFNESLNNALEYCNNNQNSLFIHPYDDVDVINGQGTIGTEILNESNPDIIIAPVGGGGLLAGIINTVNNCEIYGVEPIGADSMYKSIHNNKIIKLNKIDTFVDGASVPIVGKIPFNIINTSYKSGYLKDILKVSNGSICSEMVDLYQTEGIISEPAGALASAALSKLDKEYIKNKTIVCVLSGGNNDIMRYSEIIEKSLNHKKLKFYFIIRFKQIPGQLKQYVKDILPPLSDITRFEYIKRNNRNDGSVIIGVEFNKSDEVNILKQNMIKNNFEFIQLIETDLLYNYLI